MRVWTCVVTMLACMLVACSTGTEHMQSVQSSQNEKLGAGVGATAGLSAAAALSSVTNVNPYLSIALWVPKSAHMGYEVMSLKLPVKDIQAAGGVAYQLGDYVTIIVPADKIFKPSSNDYLRSSDPIFNNMARIIKAFPNDEILIAAHTDGVGSEFTQAKLSYKQAKAAALKLWSLGAIRNDNYTRYHYAGMGSARPIANATSGRGMMLNRRIEITLYPKPDLANVHGALENIGVQVFQLQYEGY